MSRSSLNNFVAEMNRQYETNYKNKKKQQKIRNGSSGTRNESSGTRNESSGTRNESSGTRNESSGTRKESSCQPIRDLKDHINYFGDHSNLHGVGHVCSLTKIPVFQRLFWLTFLGLCCFGAASILRSVLSLYSNDVVSYSVETDYLSWETPFPAITVCEDKVNLNRMKGWLASENMPASLSSFFKEVFYWSEKFCKCDYKPDDLNKKYIEDYQKYTYKVRYNCSQMITDCSWNGLPFECCDRFLPLETEIGICFSFNSQLTKPESTIVTLNRKARQLPELVFTTPAPQYTSLKIHGPDEAISAPTMNDVLGRKNSLLKPDGLNPPIDIDISLKVEEHTVSDISVSTLPPSLRGCLYKHEKPDFARLWPFKVYSLNTCVLYCRLIWQVNQCNCTHHFMPQLEGVPVCGISGMRCLFSYKDDFLSVGVECECPLACEDTIYKLVNMFKEDHSEEVEKGATRVRISFSSLLSLRIRRQAIRGMLTFVVDIGGLGGVFFGASLLSVIEIVYLLFIRSGP